jgi:hypothetical protein
MLGISGNLSRKLAQPGSTTNVPNSRALVAPKRKTADRITIGGSHRSGKESMVFNAKSAQLAAARRLRREGNRLANAGCRYDEVIVSLG